MKFKPSISISALLLCSLLAPFAYAETPTANLVGIRQTKERIDVTLNLSGAGEFAVDAGEVAKIAKAAIVSAGVKLADGNEAPSVMVLIHGKTSGVTFEYTVELAVTASVVSPFAKDHTIHAIIWRDSAVGDFPMSWDSQSKKFLKPSGPMNERVYDSLREVAIRLTSALKAAETMK